VGYALKMMGGQRGWTARFAGELGLLVGVCACATAHPAPAAFPSMSDADEAKAIEAAKHHPIAQPRPRTLYPDQVPPPIPVREPPLEAPPGMTPPMMSDRGAPMGEPEPSPMSNMVAPVAPPVSYADAPRYAAPGSDYVWGPGYWSWSGGNYVWIAGDWMRGRPGYVYVGPRWARGMRGWEFNPGGWARGGSDFVVHPADRYPYSPYQEYYNPGYSGSRRRNGGDDAYYGRHTDGAAQAPGSMPRGGDGGSSSGAFRQARPSGGSNEGAPPRNEVPRASSEPRMPASNPTVTRAVPVDGGGGRSNQRETVRTRR
jgi:hypothetical protein